MKDYNDERHYEKVTGKKRMERMLLVSIVFHFLLIYALIPQTADGAPELIEKPKSGMIINLSELITNDDKPSGRIDERDIRKPKPALLPIPDPSPSVEEIAYDFDMTMDPDMDIIPADAIAVFGVPENPPAPDAGGPVRLTSDVVKPRLIKKVNPVYPEIARQVGIEGVVEIEAVISGNGRVIDAKIIRGLDSSGLNKAALEAVLQWEFTPALLNGVPVDVYMMLKVVFELR